MAEIILTEEQMRGVPKASFSPEFGNNGVAKLTKGFVATIKLTQEQIRVVCAAISSIQVCDPKGNVLGTVEPEIFPEFICEMQRRARSGERGFTGEQVRKHLQALEEAWNREGPFDEKRMLEILDQARAAD
jgi:hypothetical protein